MKYHRTYDFIIVGAGCSGLSLAIKLHRSGLLKHKRLLLLDARERYTQDKSWCCWRLHQHGFEECISKSWHSWSVSFSGRSAVHTSDTVAYQYIAANDYYTYCLDYIKAAPEITLQLGVVVTHVSKHQVCSTDFSIEGIHVFDARAAIFADDLPANALLQCFYGWHVKTSQPVFNPQCATLMDFADDQSSAINFMYVLPFSRYEALIEPTFFLHHKQISKQDDFFKMAKDYLKTHYHCDSFEIIRMEKGVLPMMPMRDLQHHKRAYLIGSAYGLLRPSTGYAFYAIQRYNDKIVNALQQSVAFPDAPYSPLSAWLDAIFLRVCRHDPTRAADYFYRIFANNDTAAIVRFLQDEASLKEIVKIINSVKSFDFIKVAALHLWQR